MKNSKKVFNILSIEDNKADFDLLKKALLSIKNIKMDIINIGDGKEALEYIHKNSTKIPDLIILDINLPSISGIEILKILKNNNKYKHIPIIVFTTSDSEDDINKCYELYANSYITKTFEVNDLFKKIHSLGEFWLKSSKLPNKHIYIIKNYNKEK